MVLSVLLASTVISLYGFSTLEVPHINSAIVTVLLSAAGITALTVFTRKSPVVIGFGLIACLSIACGQAWPLIVVAVLALSSTVLGRWMLGHRISADWPVHLLVGVGAFGTLAGLAAYFPINYPWLYSTLLLLPLVLGRKHAASICYELLVRVRAARSPTTATNTLLDVLIFSFACLYVLVSFMPEIGHDALAMHLFVPSHLAQRNQWGFDASNYVWAVMPMLADWIYSIVYMLAGETASRLTNAAFMLLLALLVRDMTIWAGGTALSSRWATLIFLSTPLAFARSATLGVESIWTAFVMGGSLAIMKASSFTADAKERMSQLLLAGTMLGFAMAAKAVTLSILPILLVVLLVQYKAWARPGIVSTLLLGSVCLLLAGITPYLSAWYLTGNPVFPFFNAIFQSPLWDPINFKARRFGTGVTWDILYHMVFSSPQFTEGKVGAAGFHWLFLPAAAVALLFNGNKKALCIFVVGVGAMIMTFWSTAYLRYIFPSFALFPVVLALAMFDTKFIPRTLAISIGTLLLLANSGFIRTATFYGEIQPSALFSSAGREAYLVKRLPIRNMVAAANAVNTEHSPVAVFAKPFMAGLKSDALYASWYNVKWKAEFGAVATQRQLMLLLRRREVDWIIVDLENTPRAQLELLLNVSTSYKKIGGLDLRRVNHRYYERLLNPEFSSLEGWRLTSPSTYDSSRKILTVTVKTPATQRVKVEPGQIYISSVSARCAKLPAPGRVQTNWMNAQGAFITTSIKTFDCATEWEAHEMIVVAPADAAVAIVYASGHTDTPLEFKSLSFKD
jgi:hypothetical protein